MKIVVVITYPGLKKQLNIINKYISKIYAAEIRVDTFYPKIKKVLEILKYLKHKYPHLKTILTFRKYEEGGKKIVADKIRISTLLEIIQNNHKLVDYIDIEYSSKNKEKIICFLKKYKKQAIISAHFFNNINENIIYRVAKRIINFSKLKNIKCIIKIVFSCDNLHTYFLVLKKLNWSKNNITVFTTGKTSLISRLIAALLKMPAVYTTAQKPIVPTQPTIHTFLKSAKNIGLIT